MCTPAIKTLFIHYQKSLVAERDKEIHTMKLQTIYQEISKFKLEEVREKENIEISKLLENIQSNTDHLRKNVDNSFNQMEEMLKITYHQIKYENSNIQKENKILKKELEMLHYQTNKSEKNFEDMKNIISKIQKQIYNPKENNHITNEESESTEEDLNESDQASYIDEEFEQTKNIWLASESGHLLAVKYWIDKDPELINKSDDKENTALHLSAQKGHKEIVKYLIENGSNCNAVNREKNTPLHLAAAYGNLYIIKYLVENGADFKIKNKTRNTPQRIAYLKGYSLIFNYLKSLKHTK